MIEGEVHGCPESLTDRARTQALAAMSLDTDGSGWSEVGRRDPVIGRLQQEYGYLRPSLFHSPYEAAAAFVIGHRISIKQGRAVRARIAAEIGASTTVEGQTFYAFPTPAQVLRRGALPGLSQAKGERLHAIAGAAQDGWLAREPLRGMPMDAALAKLETLPGVGAFFAQGILFRGAGTVDTLTNEEIGMHAVTQAYELKTPVDRVTLEQIAEAWRPYRMWAMVLLHVWARSQLELPRRMELRRRRG
jgi:DNA-3-methyladenine glycosylase II